MATQQPSTMKMPPWRHPCVTLGSVIGVCLAVVAVAWLLIANRAPSLDRFALERNLIAGAAIGLLMLLPFLLFLGSPARVFLAGTVAWTILAVVYWLLGFFFVRLGDRLGAFHLFALGTIALGALAAVDWVALLLLATRRHPLVATRSAKGFQP